MNTSTPQTIERTWRDDVMGGFGWGEYCQAFLQALSRVQPQLSTYLVSVDCTRAQKLLASRCSQVNWLLSSSHTSASDGEINPNVTWCELVWQGLSLELAFMIGSGNDDVFCLGTDAKIIEEFSHALQAFADEPFLRH